jgi:hypothetical protein
VLSHMHVPSFSFDCSVPIFSANTFRLLLGAVVHVAARAFQAPKALASSALSSHLTSPTFHTTRIAPACTVSMSFASHFTNKSSYADVNHSGYDYRSILNQAQKASLDVTRSGGLFPNNRPQNGSLDTFGKPVASKNANTSTSPSAVASQSQFGRGLLQSSTPVTVSQSSATPIASSKPASKTPLIDTLKASAQSDKAVAARKDAAPLPTKQPTAAAREVTSPTLWDRMEL